MHVVRGSGGGGGKGGDSGGVESPNTLRSNAKANIVELLGSGEIVGLVLGDGTPCDSTNMGRAVFLNETVVQNDDGTNNFKGVTLDQRVGTPDQDHLPGFNTAETGVAVDVEVKVSTGPVVRTIVNDNVDAVRVVVRIPALTFSNTENGNLQPASVSYAVEYRPFGGGSWLTAETVNIWMQKCTSPYSRATLVELPDNGAPWDIRVRRITADSDTVNLQNDTYFESYTEVVRGKFIYPDRALVAMKIDAQQFGSSVPSRAYRVRGLKIDIPSNYNPNTRAYAGIWNGSFVKGWTNNPAWVLYDLIVNNRYGLGEFMPAALVDKWSFYQIAQYCDGLVPSGYNDTNGNPIMEARFTFNGVINSREDAINLLQAVAASFRGMVYYSLGQVFVTSDMPADPIIHVSPANVIDGRFTYSGTALKARHTVALVTWSDPSDFFRDNIEIIRDDPKLARFGWRQVEVKKVGCTSRGEARRFGKWILDTEQNETETVEFTMSWDSFVLENNATIKPGDIIQVSDPRKNGGFRTGGRVSEVASTSVITLDGPFAPSIGATYHVTVLLPDGSVERKQIASFSNGNRTLTLTSALSLLPKKGAVWCLDGTDISPRRYRVLSVQESEDHLFKISALFHDPTKYARVEQGIFFDEPIYVRPRNLVVSPTNATAVESRFFRNGVSHSTVTLSWTPPPDFLAERYSVTADTPTGFVDYGSNLYAPSLDIQDAAAGEWTFYIRALTRTALPSLPLEFQFTVEGWEAIDGPIVNGLEVQGGGNSFVGNAPTLVWVNEFPEDSLAYPVENKVKVYDAVGNLLREEVVSQPSYTYSLENNTNDGGPRRILRFDITSISNTGAESDPASITVSNPVPVTPNPSVLTVPSGISVAFTPTESDYAGVLVYVSTTPGFTPEPGNLKYDGPNTSVVIPVVADTYYVRIAVYDSFGKIGLLVSDEHEIEVTAVDLESIGAELNDRLRVIDETLKEQLKLRHDLDLLSGAMTTQSAVVDEMLGRIYQAVGSRYEENKAGVEEVTTAVAGANEALASFIQDVFAETQYGSAQGRVRFVASSTIAGALASFAIEVRVTTGSEAWRASGIYIDIMSSVSGSSFGRIRFLADQFVFTHPNGTDVIRVENGFLKVANQVVPGVQVFNTPGIHNLVIPSYNQIRARVYAGGGAGSSIFLFAGFSTRYYGTGTPGGQSAFDFGGPRQLLANGGGSPDPNGAGSGGGAGAGGTSSGGDANTDGESGGNGGRGAGSSFGYGGRCFGEDGGSRVIGGGFGVPGVDGHTYGGGGSGACRDGGEFAFENAPGGGGGGFVEKTWSGITGPTFGTTVQIRVGAGAQARTAAPSSTLRWRGGHGAPGAVVIEWE